MLSANVGDEMGIPASFLDFRGTGEDHFVCGSEKEIGIGDDEHRTKGKYGI